MKNSINTFIALFIVLFSVTTLYAQEPTKLQKWQGLEKLAEEKLPEIEMGIDMLESNIEAFEAAGNKEKVKELKAQIRDLKEKQKQLKMVQKKVIKVGIPLIGRDAILENYAGASATLVYNLDPTREAPMSNTNIFVQKAISNPGLAWGFTNNQFLKEGKWRMHQQFISYKYQLGMMLPDMAQMGAPSETYVDGNLMMLNTKFWRRVGNTKWYAGVKVEYNQSSVKFDENHMLPHQMPDGSYVPVSASVMDSQSEFLGTGLVLDYDSRDNVLFPSSGTFFNFNYTYLNSGLGYTTSNPESGDEYQDATANYFVANLYKYFSFSGDWTRVLTLRARTNIRVGDIGTAQYVSNSQEMRGFNQATTTAPVLLVADVEYDHFFKNILRSKLGFALWGSVLNNSGNLANDAMNGTNVSLGTGLRWMQDKNSRISFRMDYGVGFTPNGNHDMQNQFSMGIGTYL